MKNQQIFPGIILMGFGAYFFLQQSGITLFQQFYTWPTLLIIVGIAFLGQGYLSGDHEAILPGTILAGFGLHFHIVHRLAFWPDHIGSFIFIIALGFLLRYQKNGKGLFHAILFIALAVLLLFYDKITTHVGSLQNSLSMVWKFWPLALIALGIYFLLIKKNKR